MINAPLPSQSAVFPGDRVGMESQRMNSTVYHPFSERFCPDTFWDTSVTWYTDNPDFSQCFQRTALAWIPCGFLWLMFPLQVYTVRYNHQRIKRWTWVSLTKIVLCFLLGLLALVEFCHAADIWRREGLIGLVEVDLVTPVLKTSTYILAVWFIHADRRRGSHSSGILLIFWFLTFLESVIALRSRIMFTAGNVSGVTETFSSAIIFIAFPVVLGHLVLACIAEQFPSLNGAEINPSPELTSSVFSQALFAWFDRMAYLGYQRPLTPKDLWDLIPADNVHTNVERLQKHWQTELDKVKSSQDTGQVYSPSLAGALFKTFFGTLLLAAFYHLIQDLLIFAAPQILRLLIAFVHDPTEESWKGYFYAMLLLIAGFIQTFGISHHFMVAGRNGIRIRSALIASVYRKALRITSAAKRSSNVGEIVNLMSVDAQRLYDLMNYVNLLWSAPLQIGLSLYFLWEVLGLAVFAGLGMLVLTLPLNVYLARRSKTIQMVQMKHKDARINMITEVLNGIKVLKLYAWEESFEKQILSVRERELRQLQKAARLEAMSAFNWFISPFFVAWCTFAAYVYISVDNVLNAEKAFVAISLLNILRLPLTMLPYTITLLVQSRVSLKRISDFLTKDELDPDNVRKLPVGSPGPAVTIKNATLSWGVDEPTSLHNVNLQITDGQLVAIVGQVGSGKSSLVAAMLGLMEKISGDVAVKGAVAYVPQQAWIQNLTLKENILFGKEFDRKRYDRVIEACALLPDLEMLDAGDETEIGEKGANLSGGQRQRVSLARAVYADADVYFLDDPLSAVDAHVGKHIFEHVIGPNGLLSNKTRILVTHGVSYLPQTDLIVVLSQGSVSEVGTYDQLLATNGDFADFLRTYFLEEIEETILGETDQDLALASNAADMSRLHSLEILAKAQRQRTVSDNSQHSHLSTAERVREVFRSESKISRRSNKVQSVHETVGAKDHVVGKLVDDEIAMEGRVKMSVYNTYFKNASYKAVIGMVVCYAASNALNVGGSFWLTAWAADADDLVLSTSREQKDYRLGIYGMFGGLQGIFILASYLLLAYGQIMASRNLHKKLLLRIMRAPMSFFDTTPLGRIVNRFSKDVEIVDSTLPRTSEAVVYCALSVLFTLIVVCISNWFFIPVLVPLAVFYFFIQRFFIASGLQLQRLDAISRSPIYSHFQESVQGSSVILASRQGERFVLTNEYHVNTNVKPLFLFMAASRWVAIRLDFAGNFIAFFAALLGVISRNYGWGISSEQVGLSISYALSVTQVLNWLVRNVSEIESNIVSVERIKEYSEVPNEADWIVEHNRPEKNWPSSGRIKFIDYQTRYRPELDLVLKGVNCSIGSGEKIGVVGRTGAGKSSLTLALFRIIEAAGGSIVIDDVNIASLGLQDVRSRITILPQEPVLFGGSLRMNLDPFERYSEEEVWRALESSHLKDYVSALPEGLSHTVAEGGENLSVGQRQLICLARALLRKTKVLVLDEATAAIDLETDALIQDTIRTNFADCTILTIAHRINTIMDSTRIMVLDQGRVKEFDTPERLLANPKSIFFSLARSANLA